jgi:hypothetical protein
MGAPSNSCSEPNHLFARKTGQVEKFLTRDVNVKLHFKPAHSSWLDQLENLFRRDEREASARSIFNSVQELSRKLMRYIRAYSKIALPSSGNLPTFAGEFSRANELPATGPPSRRQAVGVEDSGQSFPWETAEAS